MVAAKLRLLSLVGSPLPVTGEPIDGTPFDLKSRAGKVVLIDFWATWCGPCIAEIPHVIEQYEKYHDKGFEVIGISLDRDRGDKTAKDQVVEAVTRHKIPWPILVDGVRLAKEYGITGIPQMILIGRDGNVMTLDARGDKLVEQLADLF
ncbi:MAG: TlpA family protein disulfide reductase [Planctomycetes bacterium]|nr:TlpA family protein disulfide reductase [Planctomycetota bacterium]